MLSRLALTWVWALVGLGCWVAMACWALGCSKPQHGCVPPSSNVWVQTVPSSALQGMKQYCDCAMGDGKNMKWFHSRADGVCYSEDAK